MKNLLLFLLILLSPVLQAATLVVSWEAPTECQDGTPIAACEVDSYTVFYRIGDGVEQSQSAPASPLSIPIEIQNGDSVHVQMIATDVNGRPSVRSESIDIPYVSVPKAPSSVNIIFQIIYN